MISSRLHIARSRGDCPYMESGETLLADAYCTLVQIERPGPVGFIETGGGGPIDITYRSEGQVGREGRRRIRAIDQGFEFVL
jgi:hypothetical protein